MRAALSQGLVEYINGPEAPTSGDELTFFIAREVMREFSPRLMLVNFWDMDVAHWGSYSLYLQAITKTDRLVRHALGRDPIQSQYEVRTTMLILPELGRDGDINTANGFLNHRSGDASCRNMWLLAMGAGAGPGEIERPVLHVDVAATTAEFSAFKAGEIRPAAARDLRADAGRVPNCRRNSRPSSTRAFRSPAAHLLGLLVRADSRMGSRSSPRRRSYHERLFALLDRYDRRWSKSCLLPCAASSWAWA